eukprot:Nk52_evm80s217 gene=Nk52_evmTU80s217
MDELDKLQAEANAAATDQSGSAGKVPNIQFQIINQHKGDTVKTEATGLLIDDHEEEHKRLNEERAKEYREFLQKQSKSKGRERAQESIGQYENTSLMPPSMSKLEYERFKEQEDKRNRENHSHHRHHNNLHHGHSKKRVRSPDKKRRRDRHGHAHGRRSPDYSYGDLYPLDRDLLLRERVKARDNFYRLDEDQHDRTTRREELFNLLGRDRGGRRGGRQRMGAARDEDDYELPSTFRPRRAREVDSPDDPLDDELYLLARDMHLEPDELPLKPRRDGQKPKDKLFDTNPNETLFERNIRKQDMEREKQLSKLTGKIGRDDAEISHDIRLERSIVDKAGFLGVDSADLKKREETKKKQYAKELEEQIELNNALKKRDKIQDRRFDMQLLQEAHPLAGGQRNGQAPPVAHKPLNPQQLQGPGQGFPLVNPNTYSYDQKGFPATGSWNNMPPTNQQMQMNQMLSNPNNAWSMQNGYNMPQVNPGGMGGGTGHSMFQGPQPPMGFPGAGPPQMPGQRQGNSYLSDLEMQIQLKKQREEAAKREENEYNNRKDFEMANYNPFGRGGGGAPLKGPDGKIITNLREAKADGATGLEGSYITNGHTQMSQIPGASQPQSFPQGEGFQRGAGLSMLDPNKRDDNFLRQAAQMEYKSYLQQQVEEKQQAKKKEEEEKKRLEKIEDERIEKERKRLQIQYEKELEEKLAKDKEQEELRKEREEAIRREREEAARIKQQERDERRNRAQQETLRESYQDTSNQQRSHSPPIPTMAPKNGDNSTQSGSNSSRNVKPVAYQDPFNHNPATVAILDQLSDMRKQLKSEQRRVSKQMQKTENMVGIVSSNVAGAKKRQEGHQMKNNMKEIDIFDIIKGKDSVYSQPPRKNILEAEQKAIFDALEIKEHEEEAMNRQNTKEFNEFKYRYPIDTRKEFIKKFPQPALELNTVDRQQRALLRQQEQEIEALREGHPIASFNNPSVEPVPSAKAEIKRLSQQTQLEKSFLNDDFEKDSRGKFGKTNIKDTLISDSKLVGYDGPSLGKDMSESVTTGPKFGRRAGNVRAENETKQDDDLESLTSFNIDKIEARNAERLGRLNQISLYDDDTDCLDVLQNFLTDKNATTTNTDLHESELNADTVFKELSTLTKRSLIY